MSTAEQNAANAAREIALNRAPLGQAEFRAAFAGAGARGDAAVDADESDADSVDAADSGAIKNPPPPPPVKPVEDSDFDAGSLLGNTPVQTPMQTPHQTPMHSPATSAFSMQFAVPHWTPTSGWTLPPPAPQSAPASFASLNYT